MPKASHTEGDAIHVGGIIKRLREQRGWTLIKLAQRSGMNPTYLGVLEKGGNMPSIRTLLELAEVLGVSAADIIAELEKARHRKVSVAPDREANAAE